MSNTVMVRAIRTFSGEEGFKMPSSDPFLVSRCRAAELRSNGLVELDGMASKAAPAARNKAAPHWNGREDRAQSNKGGRAAKPRA